MGKPLIRNEIVGGLPVIKYYTDRLKIVEMIDRILPRASQGVASHGECVLALLISVLQGDHRLCFVEKKLKDVDLVQLFGRTGLETSHFNDTRLGATLDALYANTAKIYGSIISSAIREFQIRPKRFHVDTTSVILRGVYDVLEVVPALRLAPPMPAQGFSKDHRPDLMQLMFGMVNSDEGIPIMGRFENGNSADTELFRKYMHDLAGMLDDLRSWNAVLVGDSKLCTFETIAQATQLDFPLITMLPETFSLRSELIEKASIDPDLPLLLETEDGEKYRGKSFKIPYLIENKGAAPTHVWLRGLAVHSTQLQKKKAESRDRAIAAEAKDLTALIKRLSAVEFACKADAEKIAAKEWKAARPRYHAMSLTVTQETVPVTKRKPGRPKKGETHETTQAAVWKVMLQTSLVPREARPFDPDGFFVLVTSVTDKRRKSDAELLEAYKGQQVVETSFKWMKGPLATAPVFLELPSRIQSLGFVLLLALLFAALLQRDARGAVKKRGGKVPNYSGRRSDMPTWQGILELFDDIRSTTVSIAGKLHRVFHNLDADQIEILTLLGIPDLYEIYSTTVYN